MISEAQIREKVWLLLESKIDLDAFEDWLAQSSWNIHAGGEPRAKQLAYAIELRLAEHSSEHLPYSDLLREIASLANPYFMAANAVSGSSNVIASDRPWSVRSSDIRPVAACG